MAPGSRELVVGFIPSEEEPLEGSEQGYDMVCFPRIFLGCQGRWQGET